MLANILEQCSLFLPLLWGGGSMALMLWLDCKMMMMMMMILMIIISKCVATMAAHSNKQWLCQLILLLVPATYTLR
jgi:hypothetical protein